MLRMTMRTAMAVYLCALSLLVFWAEEAEGDASATAQDGRRVVESCRVTPHLLVEREGRLFHPVRAGCRHSGAPDEFSILVDGREVAKQRIEEETDHVEFLVPASEETRQVSVTFRTPSGVVAEEAVTIVSARRFEIYLLPHSHVDIGYTTLQSEVEKDHWGYLKQAVEVAAKGKAEGLPREARFKWNAEVLWAVEGYLKQASQEERAAFIDAVKEGAIGLDAFYCHELAGLCRPEELVRLLECARRMRREWGVRIDSAMVTDCPGLTWGAVPVLAQSGVKYLSLGPNDGHRIGYTREAWDNRPFWWMSPSGKERVLCWQTDNAYHPVFIDGTELLGFLEGMDDTKYPYDILYYRQCRGDNRGLDLRLSAFVEDWNKRYAYPKVIIATTTEAFEAFEKRYGDVIPSAKGDFSPYWEDGACSSARETAVNRATAERLVQAETVWSMLNPEALPEDAFDEAWRNVVLYDEHTWGARSYVNRGGGCYPPGSPEYEAQWRVKQAFAVDAEAQSRALLNEALEGRVSSSGEVAAVDVLNTASWARTDLVVLPKELRVRGDLVHDSGGSELPAQRLSTGELAVLVRDVPAFGAARLTFYEGATSGVGGASAADSVVSNDSVKVVLDRETGVIRGLEWKDGGVDFAGGESGGLNGYYYVQGFDPAAADSNGSVTTRVKESGPLVASMVVESDAPGCVRLSREVRVVDGLNRVDIINVVDKKAIPLEDLLKDEPQKEGYHFGFAFDVPDGVMRFDMPWAVVRPEIDQLPGSCKNWLSAQRWVDVSNDDFGVTWATVDAPLVEVGTMSPQPIDPFKKDVWRASLEPTQTLYSYVMNNYWTTNYRHDQEGVVVFRYSVMPHKRFDAAAAARFGVERSQPLIVAPVDEDAPVVAPLLDVRTSRVTVTSLRRVADGKAWVVRLFGASGQAERVGLRWGDGSAVRAWRTNLDGEAGEPVAVPVDVSPFEMVTLRLERGGM